MPNKKDCPDGTSNTNKHDVFEAFHSNGFFTSNAIEESEATHESHKKLSAIKENKSYSEARKSKEEASIRMDSKALSNRPAFDSLADVPKSMMNENKENLSNSVVSTTTSVCTTGNKPNNLFQFIGTLS